MHFILKCCFFLTRLTLLQREDACQNLVIITYICINFIWATFWTDIAFYVRFFATKHTIWEK